MTYADILNDLVRRAESLHRDLRAVQKFKALSLSSNHEAGVILMNLKFSVVEKLQKLAKLPEMSKEVDYKNMFD